MGDFVLVSGDDIYMSESAGLADLLGYLVDTRGEGAVMAALKEIGLLDPERPTNEGIPVIDRVMPPLVNQDKAWYEYYRVYEPDHPHARFGCDWNLESMGDTDLGEPLCSPFDGVVINAGDYGGTMGRIVRVMGYDEAYNEVVVWMVAHLHDVQTNITPGIIVEPGTIIGSIGKGPQGRYSAHAHTQIGVGEVLGAPEFRFCDPFVDPVAWYRDHGVDWDLLQRLVQKDEG